VIHELKTLSRHTLIYGAGFMLIRAVGFFLLPLYTRYLTPQDYGVMEMVDLTGYLLGPLLVLGMDQAILKYYASYDDERSKHAVLTTGVIFSTLFGLALVVALIPVRAAFANHVLGSPGYSALFLLAFAGLFTTSLLNILKAILRAQGRSIAFTMNSLVQTLASVALNVYFIVVAGLGIRGIFLSTLITSALFSLYLTAELVRHAGFRFDFDKLRPMLRYGVFWVPATLAFFVVNWADRYFLRFYSDMASIGLYALGYKIAMIVVVVVATPFSQVWNAYLFEIQKKPEAKQLYARIATYYLLVIAVVGLGLAMYAREVVTIMAGPAFCEAYHVVPPLVLAMMLMCSGNVFQVGLLLTGRSGRLSVARWISAAVALGLYLALIPRYGMIGAAAATVGAFATYIGVMLGAAQRAYHIDFEYGRLVKLALVTGLLFTLSLAIPTERFWMAVVLKLAVWCAAPVALAASGFFTDQERMSARRGAQELGRLAWQRSAPLLRRSGAA